jgi:hypothetical protein
MGATRRAATLLAGVALAMGSALTLAPAPAHAATQYCNSTIITGIVRVPFHANTGGGTVFCTMKVGSRGPAVIQLQRTLNRCYGQRLAVDGSYGPKTRAAVVVAQRKTGLGDIDGVYGPKTAAAIEHEALIGQRCDLI